MKDKGFTLLELLVVIVILGILATYVGTKIMGRPDEARQTQARVQIQALENALNMYRLDNPRACPDVNELIRSKYLDGSKSAVDAWGNDFIIQCERGEIIVVSPGPDGQTGTEDDIR